jgi:hypothetical protein
MGINAGDPKGKMLGQLNELLQNMAQALDENAKGAKSRNAKPKIANVAPQPQQIGVEEINRLRQQREKRTLGESAQEKQAREEMIRTSQANEARIKQEKRLAYEKQQAKVQQADKQRHENRQIQAISSNPLAPRIHSRTILAKRYQKFLMGSKKNIRDAIVLTEILGPCHANKDY